MAALNGPLMAESGLAVEELEIELLLEAVFQRYGYDYRGYDRQAVRRKLHGLMRERGLSSVSMLQDRVLHESGASQALLRAMSVAPVGMFDDPEHMRQLRSVISSCLPASAMPRIWLAECAGAQEAWSLAILLADEGLIDRTEIYVTAANEDVLVAALDEGIAPESFDEYQARYEQSGGSGNLRDYFELDQGRLALASRLRQRISWAQYNLVTDASFNEFELIVCRRALADFGPVLRSRVLRLFHDSLSHFGVLCTDRAFEASEPLGASFHPSPSHYGCYKRAVQALA